MMGQPGLRRLGFLVVVAICSCGPYVEGGAVPTHAPGDAKLVDANSVRVSAVAVPEGASELGVVQAHVVQGNIEDVMPEFKAQVARLGGDFGKISGVTTKFEMQTRTRTESYSCGTSDKPSTCTRTVTEVVEVATTAIIGKAYRLGTQPTPKPVNAAAIVDPQPTPPTPAVSPQVPAGATTAP